MERAIVLQTVATRFKRNLLSKFEKETTSETNHLLSERTKYSKFNDFWKAVGMETKRRTGFNVQVVCDIARSVWSKQDECQHVKGTTVKFNVPRNCKTFETNAGLFFVELGVYPRNRIAIPIKKNLNSIRFQTLIKKGWTCKTYGLTPSLEIVAYLSKEEDEIQEHKNVLGIDINNKNFAYTVLTPEGEILKQGYLGQQIWTKKVRFAERRAMLQSFNALKKLKRMRHRQRNFVYTNLGQMVREIILIASRFNADVCIERLSKFKPKGRIYNKKVLTIPSYIFRRILEARCFDSGIKLNRVDPYHTSKWCSRCGAVAKNGHDGKNYALFRCKECGLTVNSDRKASLAVAVKSLLERVNPNARSDMIQISNRRVPVNGLYRASPMIQSQEEAVPPLILERGKPIGFSHG
ncbi:MAG: zinc ribbon domain-containing protein [Thaumarchaeota archaeon]|nr:zinc ribbon domain-containing protein [Nitrososphaerota archaeon]